MCTDRKGGRGSGAYQPTSAVTPDTSLSSLSLPCYRLPSSTLCSARIRYTVIYINRLLRIQIVLYSYGIVRCVLYSVLLPAVGTRRTEHCPCSTESRRRARVSGPAGAARECRAMPRAQDIPPFGTPLLSGAEDRGEQLSAQHTEWHRATGLSPCVGSAMDHFHSNI
eukprot:COSAG02_NODE_1384_length_12956_cov_126.308446_9_plen_167_part_00